MTLNETYNYIKEELLNDSSTTHDVNSAILALHESATKLWEAVTNVQNEKIQPRAAAALISIFHVMQELGIEDPEKCLQQKMEELKK